MKQFREMTDEELAIFYINGNNRAFDLLLARNQSKLFSYILFVVRNEDVANDIFQETFVKIITRLQEGKYVPSGKFGAWIMRIAHNVIMDWYRSQKADKIVEATRNNDLSNIGGDDMQIGNIENQFITNSFRHQANDESFAAVAARGCFHAILSGDVVQGDCPNNRSKHQH